ncbi:hypothetical protein [Duganella sp. BuS-21]|uniref:hypothetical protein n=1 Tax=Duganella sp. BuS-21 TaxID=2943848 RepID=UPI0035A744B2
MSIKGDVIAITIAGAVLLAAGWYAKKKVQGAVTNVTKPVKDAIAGFDNAVDGYINAAGQYITGDGGWTYYGGHTPQYNYVIPKDFGIINPNEGW